MTPCRALERCFCWHSHSLLVVAQFTPTRSTVHIQSVCLARGAGLLTHPMPGRVKYRAFLKPTVLRPVARLAARMASPQQQAEDPVFNLSADKSRLTVSEASIIWLTVIGVVVLASFILVCWLLCRCTCRKKKMRRHSNGHRHHPSLEITDGRNEFHPWNSNAPPLSPARAETGESGISLQPLTRAAVKPAREVHPGEPVIVDEEEPATPVYARSRGSRYYSGISSVRNSLKRWSHIGRAY